MIINTYGFPRSLRERIDPSQATEKPRGRLGNRIIRITNSSTGSCYLKIGKGHQARDLLDEADRLKWIGNRLPVAEVLSRECWEGYAYVLVSELPGTPSHETITIESMARVVQKLAEGLRLIHELSTIDCPFDRVVDTELAESERRLQVGCLNVDAFLAETNESPGIALAKLQEQAACLGDFVFTHGDYCFPNLLLAHGNISGIVDWGIAGICDPHRDFMSCELTLRRNCGPEWIPVFYEVYGNPDIDRERVRFFWLLDRFSSHYEPSLDPALTNDTGSEADEARAR